MMDNMDDSCTSLSVVVPAYNEADRILSAIVDITEYLKENFESAWELIVVDDGSRDATVAVVEEFSISVPQLRVITHGTNCGKGAAVRTGVLQAAGDLVVFTDADGATPFREIEKLLDALRLGAAVAVGSRLANGAHRDRYALRSLAGKTFSLLARAIVSTGVVDSQCGFKLFRRETARQLFSSAREDGYLFDLEVLGLARRMGMPVVETPVEWNEIAGSKVRIIRDSWKMLWGLLRVRKTVGERYRKASQIRQSEPWMEPGELAELPISMKNTSVFRSDQPS
jgi:dolichyl-phosphate beta-glucosyltransferase